MSTRALVGLTLLTVLAACGDPEESPRDALLRLARERGVSVGDPVPGQPGVRIVEVPGSTGTVKGRWSLRNAQARIRAGKSTPSEEIERLIAACRTSSATWDTVSAAIYPRLRTPVWVADQDARAEAQELTDRVARRPAGVDLLVTIGVAVPGGFRLVSEADLRRWEKSFDEAMASARVNLERVVPRFRLEGPETILGLEFRLAQGGDEAAHLATSLLLSPAARRRVTDQIGGDVVVLLPGDDVLLILEPDREVPARDLRTVARRLHQTSRQPFASIPFRWREDGTVAVYAD